MITDLQDIRAIVATQMWDALGRPESPDQIMPEVDRIIRAVRWAPNATVGARMTEAMTDEAINRLKIVGISQAAT